MVKRNLAKVETAGPSPVVRSQIRLAEAIRPVGTQTRAVGAEVAHFPDTEGVTSSNLVSPTIFLLYVAPSGVFWPITRFTVPYCLRWQADTRYLRFEGLISRSRNIYLRFKGLPKRDIRSMRGHPALESCGFRPGSTRAPTPRNADRCPNEDVVGKAIRESEVPREDIIVASKLPGRHHQYDQARVTIEESVARMGLDYIDLYLIHWPNPLHRSHVGRQPSRAVPLLPAGRAARLRSGAWHHHRGVEPIGPRQPDA